jgi:hypothetical protein
MKILLIFSLFISTSYASNCSEMKEAMVVLENQILKTRMPSCSEEVKEFCCRADEPDSCLTGREVNSRYNDIMAKLIIYEGIMALGASINDNHNLIKHMDNSRIQKSKKHINDFFNSLNKSELIYNSLKLNGDTGLWTNYSGQNASEMESYLNQKCNGEDFSNFCQSYNRILSEDAEKKFEYLESLHGFATADQMVLDNNRRSDYENYKKYLTLTIGNQEVPYSEVHNHPQVKKLTALKNKLKVLPTSSGDSIPKEVLQLSKELDKVHVNYNEGIQVRSRFKEFISKDIEQNIAKFNQSTQLLLGSEDFKKNVTDFQKSFDLEQKSNKASIENELLEYYVPPTGGAPQDLNCNDSESMISCLKRACRPQSDGKACDNNDPKINQFYKQISAVEKLDETSEMLASTKVCLEKKGLEAQQSCILAMKANLFEVAQDEVEDLRNELAHVEKVRLSMNQSNNIEELNQKKLMATYAYKKLGCIKNDDLKVLNNFHSSCRVQEIENLDSSILTLNDDVNNIVININSSNKINSNLSFDDPLMTAYREDLLDNCSIGNSQNRSKADNILCSHYKKVQEEDEERQRNIRRGYRSGSEVRAIFENRPGVAPVPDAPEMSEGPTWEDGAVALIGTGVSLMPSIMQYGYIKQQSEYQMQNNVNVLNNMYRRREYMNTLWQNQTPFQIQNYGYNYYNPYTATNFGGANTNSIYYTPLDYSQLSFASPQMMSSTSFNFSPTSTSGSSATTTVGFGF